MLKNRKLILLAVVGIVIAFSSCKKFLDVNQNPNVAQSAKLPLLLPTAQLYVAAGLGVDLQIAGAFYCQQWTQNPNFSYYKTLDQYIPDQDLFNSSWTNLYAACENFYQVQILADSQQAKQYKAIALLMQAYTFQVITDAWGDVPFKKALLGQYASGHITSPKYDSQMVVYKGIIANIDTALNLINLKATAKPGSDDIIYGGDMLKWKKFAYTLKLKAILRRSIVDPVNAQVDMAALYADPNLIFLASGDDALIKFTSGSTTANPLYLEQLGIGNQNIVASATCMDSMINNFDTARMKVFFEAGSNMTYSGIQQGNFNSSSTSFSIPNIYVGGDMSNSASGNAQVNLMTYSECLFLQSEAVARGWATSAVSDASLFYQAVQANFDFYNTQLIAATGSNSIIAYANYIAGAGSATLYPTGGTLNQKMRFIMLQKWFAMCGNQSFEAWTEMRRSGIDSIFAPVVTSGIGYLLPKRLLYPKLESTNNGNFPGLQPISTKVWWDLY